MQTDPLGPLIERLKIDDMPISELRQLLDHGAILVRVNAIDAVARRALQDAALVDDLQRAATAPQNSARLMGTVAVSHVAVAALLRVGTPQASEVARQLMAKWPESDREDLLWYLRSERLLA